MKTTNDPKEAWQALVDGKIVIGMLRISHRVAGSYLQYQRNGDWLSTVYIGHPPYTIIEPEPTAPKVLSFEEAVEKLVADDLKFEIESPIDFENRPDAVITILMLAVAQLCNWPITEAEEIK